jgi:hypothetical protein
LVSDRMSYMILRGCPYGIIVLKVHASTNDKIHHIKKSVYEEQERAFVKFLK